MLRIVAVEGGKRGKERRTGWKWTVGTSEGLEGPQIGTEGVGFTHVGIDPGLDATGYAGGRRFPGVEDCLLSEFWDGGHDWEGDEGQRCSFCGLTREEVGGEGRS